MPWVVFEELNRENERILQELKVLVDEKEDVVRN